MKQVNIGSEDKPFYVPEMSEEMKKWYKENQCHLPPWKRDDKYDRTVATGLAMMYCNKPEVEYKQQRYRSKQCGQTCLAMITGKSIQEVCKDMNKYRSTSLFKDIAKYLEKQGYKVTKHTGRVEFDEVPDNSVIRVTFPNKAGHFIIKHKGKYYDPAVGVVEEFNNYRKITHYIKFNKV